MARIIFLHDPSILDDGELEAVKNHTSWIITESILDIQEGDLVIARHTMWPWPKRVQRDVKRLGGVLLNGLREYVYADSCPSWSWDLQELTPKTYTDFSTLPENTSFILKGSKADKSCWKKMFAENKRAAIDLMISMNADSRFEGQDIVAREYVPLERLSWDGQSCPISTEYRIFILDGKVLSTGFYTLDVARTADGSWIVIEISDGQRAGLSNNDSVVLYSKMAEVLESVGSS